MALSSITTPKANGTYKARTVIPIMLIFTQQVKVTDLILALKDDDDNTITTAPYSSDTALLSHTINYEVATTHNCKNQKLTVTNIISGTFKDSSDNSANEKIETSFHTCSNFHNNEIYIDTNAPTVSSVLVKTLSDTDHIADNKYYLNTGDIVTMTVTFSEPVTPVGSSVLTLNTNETAICTSGDTSTDHVYQYTVSTSNLNTLLSVKNIAITNIQDSAGNTLTEGISPALQFNSKNIFIDTKAPVEPTVPVNPLYVLTTDHQITIEVTGEPGAILKYSDNGGGNYQTWSSIVTAPTENDKALHQYKIQAYQIDIAGHISPVSTARTISVDLRPIGLKSISTIKKGGTYKADEIIPITMEFYKAVNVTEGILTLNTGEELNFSESGKTIITVNYLVPSGHNTTALKATKISGKFADTTTGPVSTFENVTASIINGNISNGTIESDNLPAAGSGNEIIIDTTNPTVETISATETNVTLYNTEYNLGTGKTLTLQVTTSEKVIVTGTSTLELSNGA